MSSIYQVHMKSAVRKGQIAVKRHQYGKTILTTHYQWFKLVREYKPRVPHAPQARTRVRARIDFTYMTDLQVLHTCRKWGKRNIWKKLHTNAYEAKVSKDIWIPEYAWHAFFQLDEMGIARLLDFGDNFPDSFERVNRQICNLPSFKWDDAVTAYKRLLETYCRIDGDEIVTLLLRWLKLMKARQEVAELAYAFSELNIPFDDFTVLVALDNEFEGVLKQCRKL